MRLSQDSDDNSINILGLMKPPTADIFSDLNTQRLEMPLKENAVSLWENNYHLALEF